MSSNTGKKYGLIIPNAKKKLLGTNVRVLKARSSVFGDDSSSDEDGQKEVNSQIHKEAMKKMVQKQTQIDIQKALEQDSTVYEYDSIYDDLKEQNKVKIPDSVAKADKQRKPKYIANLLKTAEKRTKERERREERKIQKEREKEGDEFSDKPEFVTSAYKKKMQERQEEIEKEKRMDAIEEALDVKKQKDMSGFYRHFLNQQMGEEKISDDTEKKENEEGGIQKSTLEPNEDEDTDLSFSSSESEEEEEKPTPDEDGRVMEKLSGRDSRSDDERKKRGHSSNSSSSEDLPRQRTPDNHHSDRRKREVEQRRRSNERRNKISNRNRSRSPYSRHNKHRSRNGDNYYRRKRRSRSRSPRRSRSRSPKRKRSPRRRSRSRSPRQRRRRSQERKPVKGKEKRLRSRSKEKSHDSKGKQKDKLIDKQPDVSDDIKVEDVKKDVVVGPAMEDKQKSSFAKRTDTDQALSARERYLARKAAQSKQPVVEPDSD